MTPVISIEDLGKRYRISHQRRESYTTLRDVLAGRLRSALRRNASAEQSNLPAVEDFWALRGVTLRVDGGDTVAIIGRNGAGKSTLLKLISRITEPTTGRIRLRGRVASLLEVGTGFHMELTGRQNIFLNGAILGMQHREIKSKFDDIVAFSGVEKFLDTPVKRYSSGMFIRLAFAVAAHLEAEILIVDEVLAVGDAEFQKRCLGKMSEVAHSGRTVLFVSHNMAAVKSLTKRGVLLSEGQVLFDGPTEAAISRYAALTQSAAGDRGGATLGKGRHASVLGARLIDQDGNPAANYVPGQPLYLEVTLETDGSPFLSLEAFITDTNRIRLGMASLYQFHGWTLPTDPGKYVCQLSLEPLWLASGSYFIDLATSQVNSAWDHKAEAAITFEVLSSNPNGLPWDFKQSYEYGALALLATEQPVFQPMTPDEIEAIETSRVGKGP